MTRCYVAGVGVLPFGKHPEKGLKELAFPAISEAIEDSCISPSKIGMAFVGNAYGGITTGQESIRGQVILDHAGFSDLPIINVENACASASTAFFSACIAIEAERCDVALVLGVEKLYLGDTARSIRAISTSADVEIMSRAGMQFTGLYAMKASAYMHKYGAEPRHFAMVAAKNSRNGSLNPKAQFRKALSVPEILASPMICEPLTRYMCCSIADGAAAAIVVSRSFARRHGLKHVVKVEASELASGRFDDRVTPTNDSTVARIARRAYEIAGLGPQDVQVAEVHDAAASVEFEHAEDLGFCGQGDGFRLAEAGETEISGRIPMNTSGGLLARGHPAGATGLAQIAEIVWQLRGQADERQVTPGQPPRIGLALNTGGRVGDDRAATAVHIFARESDF